MNKLNHKCTHSSLKELGILVKIKRENRAIFLWFSKQTVYFYKMFRGEAANPIAHLDNYSNPFLQEIMRGHAKDICAFEIFFQTTTCD